MEPVSKELKVIWKEEIKDLQDKITIAQQELPDMERRLKELGEDVGRNKLYVEKGEKIVSELQALIDL